MTELRAVAAFFRISLNEAVRFLTDADIAANIGELLAQPLVDMGAAW